jgi:hypothetical protein
LIKAVIIDGSRALGYIIFVSSIETRYLVAVAAYYAVFERLGDHGFAAN